MQLLYSGLLRFHSGEGLEILHSVSQHSQTLWVTEPLKSSAFSPKYHTLFWLFFSKSQHECSSTQVPPPCPGSGQLRGQGSQAASRTSAPWALLRTFRPLAGRTHYGSSGYCYFTLCTSVFKRWQERGTNLPSPSLYFWRHAMDLGD